MKCLSFIVFLFSAMLFADTTNVSGNVSGSWTTSNSPYIVTNNLVLQPLDTLTTVSYTHLTLPTILLV